jgi:hypothetical protein
MWGSTNLGLEWFEQNTKCPSIIDSIHYFGRAQDLEIIGNIHQNQELLEGYERKFTEEEFENIEEEGD